MKDKCLMNGDDKAQSNNAPPWISYGVPLKMGLRGCDEASWLLEDDFFGNHNAVENQIALKDKLCHDHHGNIFQSVPEALEASQELYDMIDKNLQLYHDQRLAHSSSLHPLDIAGRAIAEDICLLAPIGDIKAPQWVLKAAFLAFPSHWSLAEKLNQPMGAIHSPVPNYDSHLESAVDRFFTKMVTGPISKRRNWTLQIDDTLFTPHRPASAPLYQSEVGARLHVRVEIQTLRKMPKTGWIIFTIRTAIAPLERWQHNCQALEKLRQILSAFSPSMRDYRGVESYEKQLHHWIDSLPMR